MEVRFLSRILTVLLAALIAEPIAIGPAGTLPIISTSPTIAAALFAALLRAAAAIIATSAIASALFGTRVASSLLLLLGRARLLRPLLLLLLWRSRLLALPLPGLIALGRGVAVATPAATALTSSFARRASLGASVGSRSAVVGSVVVWTVVRLVGAAHGERS